MYTAPLKFRAWDKETEKMYDVEIIGWRNRCLEEIILITDEGYELYQGDKMLESIELVQSTGLFDSEKKEIFGGDIVRHEQYVGVVNLSPYGCFAGDFIGTDEGMIGFDYCEILGNIFEHKHLLKDV
jgi:uncharacterized phage protein (TIGR01671 family)